MRVLGVIPARLGSTRLPNKPLQLLAGEPLITRVIQRVMTRTPKTAALEDLAAAAVGTMERHGVIALPVLDGSGAPVGAVHLHDLMRAGAV